MNYPTYKYQLLDNKTENMDLSNDNTSHTSYTNNLNNLNNDTSYNSYTSYTNNLNNNSYQNYYDNNNVPLYDTINKPLNINNQESIDNTLKTLPNNLNFYDFMNNFYSYDDNEKYYVITKYYKKLFIFYKIPEYYINKINLLNIQKYISDKHIIYKLFLNYINIVKKCDSNEKVILISFLNDEDKINIIKLLKLFVKNTFTAPDSNNVELFLKLYKTISDENYRNLLSDMFIKTHLYCCFIIEIILSELSKEIALDLVSNIGIKLGEYFVSYYQELTNVNEKLEYFRANMLCLYKTKIEYYVYYCVLVYYDSIDIINSIKIHHIINNAMNFTTFQFLHYIAYINKFRIQYSKTDLDNDDNINILKNSSLMKILNHFKNSGINKEKFIILLNFLNNSYYESEKINIMENNFVPIIDYFSSYNINKLELIKIICQNYKLTVNNICNNFKYINNINGTIMLNELSKNIIINDYVNLKNIIKNKHNKIIIHSIINVLDELIINNQFNIKNYDYVCNLNNILILLNDSESVDKLVNIYWSYLCEFNLYDDVCMFETKIMDNCSTYIKNYYAIKFYNHHHIYGINNLDYIIKNITTNKIQIGTHINTIYINDINIIKKIISRENLFELLITEQDINKRLEILKVFIKKDMINNINYEKYIFSMLDELIIYFPNNLYNMMELISKFIDLSKFKYCIEKNKNIFGQEYDKIINFI